MAQPGPDSDRPPNWYPASDGPFERWWDGREWTVRTRPLGGVPAEPGTPTRSVAARVAGWLILLAGAVVALAAFLPWATSDESTDSGIGLYYGIVTLVLGLVAGGTAVIRAVGAEGRVSRNVVPLVALVAGVLILLIGLGGIVAIGSIDLFGSERTDVRVGLNVTALGGLGMVGASVLAFLRRG